MISADENFRFLCFLVVKDLDEVDKLDPAGTLSLACLIIFHVLSSADIFKVNYFKTFYQEHYESANGLDPDQGQPPARPDPSPNCLQRTSADDKFRC